MAGNSTEPGRSVTSRVASILLSFVDTSVHSLTEIARLTGLPVSTAHRLAVELTARHMLERDESGQYRLTPALRQLGAKIWHTPTLNERAPFVLDDLYSATRVTARLGVVAGLSVRYIEKRDPAPVTSFDAPAHLPMHATAMGKTLLAFSPVRLTDGVIAKGLTPYTRETLSTPDRLRHNLSTIRQTRVALSSGELKPGSNWVAMPVLSNGKAIAAIELQIKDDRRDMPLATAALSTACRCLSRELVEHAEHEVDALIESTLIIPPPTMLTPRPAMAG